jgi:hypothetical protein
VIEVAPIASAARHPADCEARYGGMVDTKLSKFEVAAFASGGLAMRFRMLVYSVKQKYHLAKTRFFDAC